MIYPNWVRETLKSRALVAERGMLRPLESLIQEVLQSLKSWTQITVYPCETSCASVDILTNRPTNERAAAWDSRCFEYLDAALAVAIADPDLNAGDNLQWILLARTVDKCASRLLKNVPQYAFEAKKIQQQIMGSNRIGSVMVRDPLRLTNLKD